MSQLYRRFKVPQRWIYDAKSAINIIKLVCLCLKCFPPYKSEIMLHFYVTAYQRTSDIPLPINMSLEQHLPLFNLKDFPGLSSILWSNSTFCGQNSKVIFQCNITHFYCVFWPGINLFSRSHNATPLQKVTSIQRGQFLHNKSINMHGFTAVSSASPVSTGQYDFISLCLQSNQTLSDNPSVESPTMLFS